MLDRMVLMQRKVHFVGELKLHWLGCGDFNCTLPSPWEYFGTMLLAYRWNSPQSVIDLKNQCYYMKNERQSTVGKLRKKSIPSLGPED